MEPVNCTASELSTYLQALEAGFLPTFYSDTSPFALSSSIRIASKSWRSGKRMVTFPGFPSLPMSASSTDGPGADLSMSSPGGSPARTSVSPAKAPESTVSDPGYGVKWRGSLAKYDPDSRSWKTAQHSLIEDSDECLETWPRSGTTVDGQCYLLPTLAPRTVGSGSGLWQTPVADDSVNRAAGKFNSRGEPKLSAQVMLPTPSASQSDHRPAKTWNPKSQSGRSLGCMAATNMWPTPHGFSPDGRSNGPSGNELGRAVNQSLAWPTPTSSLGTKGGRVTPRKSREGGSLHPDWVELLMGWPKGWTSLDPLESSEMRGWGDGWEDDTPRVQAGVPNRVQRLKAIGNGQVPQCAAAAWGLLA